MVGFLGGYKLDIAFVIDASGGMGPIMPTVKKWVLSLGDIIKEKIKEIWPVDELRVRVRVIDFSDFASEGSGAIHASEFYNLPDEREQFENCVKNIQCDGGGDIPENALEALWVAMNSDWVDLKGVRGRHVIVLITDAMPLDLRARAGCIGYVAEDYPENLKEMEEVWNERSWLGEGSTRLSPTSKRLILIAPEDRDAEGHSWNDVVGWNYTAFFHFDNNIDKILSYFDSISEHVVREVISAW